VAVTPGVLELVIDELVLDGVTPDDPRVRAALAEALGPSLGDRRGAVAASATVAAAVERAADGEATG
jgi:hypothetical protein